MKKVSFIILIIITFLVIGVSSVFAGKTDIDKVLSEKYYSSLPTEAKTFIKEVYKKTGEIVLVEGNKKENEPYLNPDYIDYLKNGKNSEYGHVPEVYIIDHTYKNDVITKQRGTGEKTSLSYYNLRDDGYITNIYDQGSEGICWSFASATSLESHIAIKSNKTKMLTFSEKQIDYATTDSSKAIDVGVNPFIGSSEIIGENLNDGGNMLRFVNATAVGVSPLLCEGNCSNGVAYNNDNHITSNKYWKYSYNNVNKHSPYEITNIDNIEYSVDEFLFYNPLTTNNQEDVDSLVGLLKQHIVNNGSLYVAVGAYSNLSVEYTPTEGETALNSNGKNVIYYIPYGWALSSGTNHAVSIIGWDDNYTHNICLDQSGSKITNAINLGSSYYCSAGSLYTINGAWILQNSWGNTNTFIYLPYTSVKSSYSGISGVSEVDYDNSYRIVNKSSTFNKGNTKELVNKVKFFLNVYNASVSVYYNSSNHEIFIKDIGYSQAVDGTLLKSISYTQPGLYTIDISDQNIIFDENVNSFKVTFLGSYIKPDYYASVHTKNITSDKYIDLASISSIDETILTKCDLNDNKCISSQHLMNFDDNNAYLLSGVSRNLSSNNNLTFKVLNSDNEDVSNLFHFFRNFPVSNYINAIVSYYNGDIPLGTYTIEVYYDSVKYDVLTWNITSHKNTMPGNGTVDSPYIIKTVSDLNSLRNLDTNGKYFKLNNDIDLTYDTTNSNGKYYNSGKGWVPISGFYGNLDGNNHVIKGLYINRENDTDPKPVGLFDTIYGNGNYIKNLIIKDANINGKYYAGALAGKVSVTTSIDINNVSVSSGKVNSTYYAGGLIGGVNSTYGVTDDISITLYNIYSNTIVGNTSTTFSGGVVGVIESTNQVLSAAINDVVSYSKVKGNGTNGHSAIGGIAGSISIVDNVTISKVISAGSYEVQTSTRLGDVAGYVGAANSISINNAYYLSKVYGVLDNNGSNNINNNNYTTRASILSSNYTNNFDHSSSWTKPNISGVIRLPMLSSLKNHFDFTEPISDFEMLITGTKNIYDLIRPNTDSAKNIEWDYDSEYLSISSSGVITPKKDGTTILHINSLYDGYSQDINVTIVSTKTVTFNSNNSSSQTKSQVVAVGQDFSLEGNTFTYKGHTFNKWNTKSDGSGTNYSNEQLIEGGITSDLVLYAIWDDIPYTIIFNGNGGTSASGNEVTWNLTYPQNGTVSFGNAGFTRENYYIDNWNTKSDGSGTKFLPNLTNYSINFDDIPFNAQNTITLYAQWELNKYTITFNANDGEGTMNPQEVSYNVPTNLNNNTFIRTGYTFAGWNTASDGSGNAYTNLQSVTLTNNLTLYAQWEINNYILTFNANGGEGTMSQVQVPYNTTIQISKNTFTKVGYDFNYWNTKSDGSGSTYRDSDNIIIDKDITLYAIWKLKEYTITYDPNGGTGSIIQETAYYNTPTNLYYNSYLKTGYHFVEWNTASDGSGVSYLAETTPIINEDITLYAIWEINKYNITFFGKDPYDMTVQSVSYNTPTKLNKNTFTKDEYRFIKWNTVPDGSGVSYDDEQIVSITRDLELYAIWETSIYTITYDSNGGMGSMYIQRTLYNVSAKLSKNTYTRNGYKFLNWNTKSDGSGVSYSDEQVVSLSSHLYLYAMWEIRYVTGTYINRIEKNNNSLTLYFDEDEDAANYDIYRSTTKSKNYMCIASVTTNKYTDSGLKYGTTYYYKIIVRNINNKSSYSNIISAKVVPNKVENLKVTSVNTTKVKLAWDKVSVTGYEVYMGTKTSYMKKVTTISKNSTVTYKKSSLKANTTYYFKVRAYKTVSGKKVYGSFSEIIKVKTSPSTPTISASTKDYKSVKVKVPTVKGSSKYILEMSTDKSVYTKIDEYTASGTYVVNNLELGKTYYFRLKACNSSNYCSSYSKVVSKKVIPATPVVSLSTPSTKTILVSIKNQEGTSSFKIYRSTRKSSGYKLVATISGEDELLEYIDTTKKGATYYYKVRSVALSGGTSIYSSYSSIKSLRSK